jgi:hypothetical protein
MGPGGRLPWWLIGVAVIACGVFVIADLAKCAGRHVLNVT